MPAKPRWWQVYLLAIIWVGLLFAVHFWNASQILHDTARVAITLCCYGAFNMWLSLNSDAIEYQDEAKREAAEGKAPAISRQQAHYRWLMRITSQAHRKETETAHHWR
jgi:hypothetical protein